MASSIEADLWEDSFNLQKRDSFNSKKSAKTS